MINPKSKLAQEFWKHGKLKDCPVFNFHGHMHEAASLYMPRSMPEDMVRSMDEANSTMTFFCGHRSMLNPSYGQAEDMRAVRKFPERLRAYHAVVTPHANPKADLKRMEENPDVFVGVKFHPDWYDRPMTDPRNKPYWEYANEHGLLVLCHTWGHSPNNDPDQVAKILSKYKKLVFVGAHGFHDRWHRAHEFANTFPNYYFELTAIIDDRGPLELFLANAKRGSEAALFGTDLPWFSNLHGIGGVLDCEMTDDDRRNIFYRNALRILSRFDWFAPIWEKRGNGEPIPGKKVVGKGEKKAVGRRR